MSGQRPEPVARQGTTGQVSKMAAYTVEELVLSTLSCPLSANLEVVTQCPWARTSSGLAVPPAATVSTWV